MINPVLSLAVFFAATGALAAPQGVTGNIPAPGRAPGSCSPTTPQPFGLAIAAITGPNLAKRQLLTQITDGQIQAAGARQPEFPQNSFFENEGAGRGNQIADGQIQAGMGRAETVPAPLLRGEGAVTQIADGQIQAAGARQPEFPQNSFFENEGAGRGNQIADGQIQAGMSCAEAVPAPLLRGEGAVTQITDGQIQVPGAVEAGARGAVNQIADAQIQTPAEFAMGRAGGVTQIADGQIQVPGAVEAAGSRGAVNQIADAQIQAPAEFAMGRAGGVTEIADGQIQAGMGRAEAVPAPLLRGEGAVTQITDGQIQVSGAVEAGARGAVNQIADAQIQTPAEFAMGRAGGVTQIADGQIQVPGAVTQIPDGQIQAPGAVSQIADGQIQVQAVPETRTEISVAPESVGASFRYFRYFAETPAVVVAQPQLVSTSVSSRTYAGECDSVSNNNFAGRVTQIGDGQLQVPAGRMTQIQGPGAVEVSGARGAVTQIGDGQIQTPADIGRVSGAVNQIAEGQIQAPAAARGGAVNQIADGQIQAPAVLSKRQNGSPLSIYLANGQLKDNLGRTGYIADNRQLQFDAPPQSGAIYTGGFSACDDGKLAMGDQKTFYACGSSNFNNIYDKAIHPENCSPVEINIVPQ